MLGRTFIWFNLLLTSSLRDSDRSGVLLWGVWGLWGAREAQKWQQRSFSRKERLQTLLDHRLCLWDWVREAETTDFDQFLLCFHWACSPFLPGSDTPEQTLGQSWWKESQTPWERPTQRFWFQLLCSRTGSGLSSVNCRVTKNILPADSASLAAWFNQL